MAEMTSGVGVCGGGLGGGSIEPKSGGVVCTDEMEILIISFTYQWFISGQPEVETSQTTYNILFRAIKHTLFSPANKLYFFLPRSCYTSPASSQEERL